MFIETKSLALKYAETVKLIKYELSKARTADKGLLKPLHKKLTKKLKLLADIAEKLSETSESCDVFSKEFVDNSLALYLPLNICIKSVWDIIMVTLIELITSTGTISLDIEELKDLSWADIKKLAQSLGDVIV